MIGDAKHFEGREETQEILKEFGWFEFLDVPGQPAPYGLSAQFWDHTLEHVVGGLWKRPQMGPRDRELIMLALIAATPSPVGLFSHLRNAHFLGFSAQAVREILLMVAFYAGWPKAQGAIIQFEELVNQPDSPYANVPDAPGEISGATAEQRANQVLNKLGWENYLGPGNESEKRYGKTFHQVSIEHLYGGIWARPALTVRDREMIAIALTLASSALETLPQHLENAYRIGITAATIVEIILTTSFYSGWPKAGAAVRMLREVVSRPNSPYNPQEV